MDIQRRPVPNDKNMLRVRDHTVQFDITILPFLLCLYSSVFIFHVLYKIITLFIPTKTRRIKLKSELLLIIIKYYNYFTKLY